MRTIHNLGGNIPVYYIGMSFLANDRGLYQKFTIFLFVKS